MANEILVTRGLTKRYGNHLAVDHVELSIQKGQIYGLVGRNGAGKTTLFNCLTDELPADSGQQNRHDQDSPTCWWHPR